MSFIKSIVSSIGGKVLDSAGSIIDNLTTTDEEKHAAKERLSLIVFDALNEAMKLQTEVLKTEMQGNWLQKSWRPLVMLTFTVMIVLGAFKEIPYLESSSPFWSLLELGLGGYVIGRTVEKVSETVTQNIDLTFLKKKDRA
jgi:hypothetical protein